MWLWKFSEMCKIRWHIWNECSYVSIALNENIRTHKNEKYVYLSLICFLVYVKFKWGLKRNCPLLSLSFQAHWKMGLHCCTRALLCAWWGCSHWRYPSSWASWPCMGKLCSLALCGRLGHQRQCAGAISLVLPPFHEFASFLSPFACGVGWRSDVISRVAPFPQLAEAAGQSGCFDVLL